MMMVMVVAIVIVMVKGMVMVIVMLILMVMVIKQNIVIIKKCDFIICWVLVLLFAHQERFNGLPMRDFHINK